jgi:hypothetical protein
VDASREIDDRFQIREVMNRYALALDTNDAALLATVFTPDHVAHVPATADTPSSEDHDPGTGAVTMHYMLNLSIDLRGDVAHTVCSGLTIHVKPDTPGGDLLATGNRYHDRLVRSDVGWRIEERNTEFVWAAGNIGVLPARWQEIYSKRTVARFPS